MTRLLWPTSNTNFANSHSCECFVTNANSFEWVSICAKSQSTTIRHRQVQIVLKFLSLFCCCNRILTGILRVFRLLRSLRPLRVINRAPGLKLVVQTLMSSLRPIGNIVLICCTFFIIFGILGVQLFKGKQSYFQYCTNLNWWIKSTCTYAQNSQSEEYYSLSCMHMYFSIIMI